MFDEASFGLSIWNLDEHAANDVFPESISQSIRQSSTLPWYHYLTTPKKCYTTAKLRYGNNDGERLYGVLRKITIVFVSTIGIARPVLR